MKIYFKNLSFIFSILILRCVDTSLCSCNDAPFLRKEGKVLSNNVFKTVQTNNEMECFDICLKDSLNCASVNYKISGADQGICQLNRKIWEPKKENLEDEQEFIYMGIKTRKCLGKNIIFSPKKKICLQIPKSCRGYLDNVDSLLQDGVYMVLNNSLEQYPVYCHMTDIAECGGGGWTLVMTLDGAQRKFNYSSPYWSNKETYNVQDGLEGLTDKETKLASFWNTPFTKICLGMKVNDITNWIRLDYVATSLYDVFADGVYRKTTVGRDVWKRLLADSSLQLYCDREGFNNYLTVNYYNKRYPLHIRVGIAGNDYKSCSSCDSFIGFGVHNYESSITCGNFVEYSGDNGNKDTPAIGYLLVA